jgi:predicted secreted protein
LDQQRKNRFAEALLRGLIVFDSTKAPCTDPVGEAQVIVTREILALFVLEVAL